MKLKESLQNSTHSSTLAWNVLFETPMCSNHPLFTSFSKHYNTTAWFLAQGAKSITKPRGFLINLSVALPMVFSKNILKFKKKLRYINKILQWHNNEGGLEVPLAHLLKKSAILLFLIFLCQYLPGPETTTAMVTFRKIANQQIHCVDFFSEECQMNAFRGEDTSVHNWLWLHRDWHTLQTDQ